MDNKKDDNYYIEKTIKEIDLLIKSTKSINAIEELVSDEMFLRGVVFTLGQIAENIKKISQEYKDKHPYIQWRYIIDFRNNLIHEYGKTDFTIVFEIVKNQMIPLKDVLENNNVNL